MLGHFLFWRYRCCCYSAYRHQLPSSLPRRTTHPDLPQGKEQVTLPIVISPHLTSPEGEGQILLVRLKTSGQAGFCLSPNGVCHIGDKWATSVQLPCPSGATCLPMLGNVLTPGGHAACPGWADLLSDVCPIS